MVWNGLKMIWKNNIEWFDFANFDVVSMGEIKRYCIGIKNG